MKRIVILYGSSLALLVFVLKFLQYRYFIRDLSLEIYLGVIAIVFTAVGIWAGLRLTTRKKLVVVNATEFKLNEEGLRSSGLSKREHEVLDLIAKGHSNQEIADKLFVSLNTVKTHSSNIFLKLDVKRRTQAIQKAKDMGIIP